MFEIYFYSLILLLINCIISFYLGINSDISSSLWTGTLVLIEYLLFEIRQKFIIMINRAKREEIIRPELIVITCIPIIILLIQANILIYTKVNLHVSGISMAISFWNMIKIRDVVEQLYLKK